MSELPMFPKPGAGKITLTPAQRKKKREQLFHEQHGRCYFCGKRMTLEPFLMNSATLEHLVPEKMGQKKNDADSNLACSCLACNVRKGSRRDFNG